MRLHSYGSASVYRTDTVNWLGLPEVDSLSIAITTSELQRSMARGLRWPLGQLYGIVGPGAIFTRYVFQGLQRPMYVGNDRGADRDKLALVWSPSHDVRLEGPAESPRLEKHPAPLGRVFVTYISPNRMNERFPDIHGWIEHWTWVDEDPANRGRPVDWNRRYDACVWESR